MQTVINPKKAIKQAETDPFVNWGMKVNEIEMRYKTRPYDHVRDYPQLKSSSQTAEVLKAHYNDLLANSIEYFSVLYLNTAGRAIGFVVTAMGGISGVVADPRMILKGAILGEASSIILCHNHPSGNLRPSQADVTLTEKVREAGKLMDIKVLDHIIIADSGYYSFADEGML